MIRAAVLIVQRGNTQMTQQQCLVQIAHWGSTNQAWSRSSALVAHLAAMLTSLETPIQRAKTVQLASISRPTAKVAAGSALPVNLPPTTGLFGAQIARRTQRPGSQIQAKIIAATPKFVTQTNTKQKTSLQPPIASARLIPPATSHASI